MGGQCLLVLIGLKVLVMMNSLQNIVISGAQGLLMLMGSKFLIKMTRPQNTVNFQAYQNQEVLAAHFISHLFQQGLFISWPPFFTPGVFLIRLNFHKKSPVTDIGNNILNVKQGSSQLLIFSHFKNHR